MDAISCTDLNEIDRAILFAVERKWLRISGVPPHSVSITPEGIDQITKRKRR
jgi:hypothetical protein